MPGLSNVPRFNFTRLQTVAANQINRWGRDAVIRRPGRGDIPVRVVIYQYEPSEYPGERLDVLDRVCLISPTDQNGNPVPEPDPEQDRLVTWQVDPVTHQAISPLAVDENLQIVMKPGRILMDGTPVYWEVRVRR